MRIRKLSFGLSAAALASFVVAGCSGDPKTDTAKKPPASSTKHAHDEEGHDHEGHDDHDHGDHNHPSEGPHHGHLIELGKEEYHGELLHDEKTVTIYILDASAKKEVPVKEDAVALNVVLNDKPAQFPMKAVGVQDGMASQFTIEDVELAAAFQNDKVAKGRLSVTIDDTPYVGTIDHHPHGEHEHGDHEDGDHEHGDHAKEDHEDHDHE